MGVLKCVSELLVAGCCAILAVGCSSDGTIGVNKNSSTSEETSVGLFKITANANTPFARIAARAELVITGDDLNELVRALLVTDSSVEGRVPGIPAGDNRLFEVSVYDASDSLQYRGSAVADLPRGATVRVPINLYRTVATAIINGTIKEYPYPYDENSLVAAYTFDVVIDDSIVDVSGNGNGFRLDGPTLSAGAIGNGLLLDGVSDKAVFGVRGLPMGKEPRTIAFWARVSDNQPRAPMIGYGDPVIAGGQFQIQNFASPLRSSWGSGISMDVGWKVASTELRFNGEWKHLAAIFDPTDESSLKLYVNGSLVLDTMDTGLQVDTKLEGGLSELRIGYISHTTAGAGYEEYYCKGSIDEILVYNRVLSAEEVLDIYYAGGASGQ